MSNNEAAGDVVNANVQVINNIKHRGATCIYIDINTHKFSGEAESGQPLIKTNSGAMEIAGTVTTSSPRHLLADSVARRLVLIQQGRSKNFWTFPHKIGRIQGLLNS